MRTKSYAVQFIMNLKKARYCFIKAHELTQLFWTLLDMKKLWERKVTTAFKTNDKAEKAMLDFM